MTEPGLISHPDEITAAWLTQVLQHAGIDATVSSFDAKSIGTGQVGENMRFQLQGSGDIPDTIVGKFPSPDPVSKQTGIDLLNYKREVHFYRHLQETVAIQTPTVFFTDIDPETHDFVIMMEDLAPGEQGDQLAGCDAGAAEVAMVQLAHLHGPRWADNTLVDGEIVTENTADGGEQMQQLYNALAPGFLQRYGNVLSDDEKDMVRQVGENIIPYISGYTGSKTLIHIDYRLDNMMFGGPYPLAVVDWQSISFGCALNDAAYFTGTSLHDDVRASVEEALLRKYHAVLVEYNADLSWDDCWHYYRHYAPAGLIMAVIASMIVGETERGNEMFMAMTRRSARMSRELDAIEAISR